MFFVFLSFLFAEMTVEEQLRLKEEKKKLIKAQLEADKEAATKPGSAEGTASNPESPVAPKKRVLRSAESLVHLKAIVEVQIEEVEEAKKKKKKSSNPSELEATMAKLSAELTELDSQIVEITSGTFPKVRKASKHNTDQVDLF